MPMLDNQRHELFAQALASGSSATDAYEEAGFTPNRSAASRLSTNVNIEARVAELQARAAKGVVISRQKVLEELAAIAFAPIGTDGIKTADKRNALNDIARIEGWVVERSEVGAPGDFSHLTDEELRAVVEEGARGLGYVPAEEGQGSVTRSPKRARGRGTLN